MYGVVAGQRGAGGGRRAPGQSREGRSEERAGRGLRDSILAYVKRQLNPQPEEECTESLYPAARHRPEELSTLARSTHFTQQEIKLIYRGFKQECPSGMVDEEGFKQIFSQFFPLGDASQYAHLVFNTIKHKQSGNVNFEEFLGILSRVARGSVQEKLAWVFSLYDVDGDGRISRQEMLALMDANKDGVVTPDELAQWCARDPALLGSFHSLDTVL